MRKLLYLLLGLALLAGAFLLLWDDGLGEDAGETADPESVEAVGAGKPGDQLADGDGPGDQVLRESSPTADGRADGDPQSTRNTPLRVRFFAPDRRPLAGASIWYPQAGEVRTQTAAADGGFAFPAAVREALVLHDEARVSLIDLARSEAEVVLQEPAPIRMRVVDAESLDPIAGIEVRAELGMYVREEHPWAAELLGDQLTEVSAGDGRLRLAHGAVGFHPGVGWAELDYHFLPQTQAQRQRYGDQDWERFDFDPPDEETEVLVRLPPFGAFAVRFVPDGGAIPEVARASWVLGLNDVREVLPLDAEQVVEFRVPLLDGIPELRMVVLDLGDGDRVFVSLDELIPPEVPVIPFSLLTFPLRGVVRGMPEGARLEVASRPMQPESLDAKLNNSAFPGELLEWHPVGGDGEFHIPHGWMGQRTVALLRDSASGVVLAQELIHPGQPVTFEMPALAEVRFHLLGGVLPEGMRLICTPTGDAWQRRELELDFGQGEWATLRLPAKKYLLDARWGDGKWARLKMFVARAGEAQVVEVPALELRELEVHVRGSMRGPLAGARVFLPGKEQRMTDAEGVARAEVLLGVGKSVVTVAYPSVLSSALAVRSHELQGDESLVEFHFEEGRVQFALPRWLPAEIDAADCSVFLGRPRIGTRDWQVPYPPSGTIDLTLPVEPFQAWVSYPEAEGSGFAGPLDFEVAPNGTTVITFEEVAPTTD